MQQTLAAQAAQDLGEASMHEYGDPSSDGSIVEELHRLVGECIRKLSEFGQMGGGGAFKELAGPNLFVKQTRRGCLQELMGCEVSLRLPKHDAAHPDARYCGVVGRPLLSGAESDLLSEYSRGIFDD